MSPPSVELKELRINADVEVTKSSAGTQKGLPESELVVDPDTAPIPLFEKSSIIQSFEKQSSDQSFQKSTPRHVSPYDQKRRQGSNMWGPKPDLRTPPSYYPMELSNCILNVSWEVFVNCISACFRNLSIHAVFFDKPASAALLTPEYVELYLALWKTPQGEIQLEVQRRSGDSMIFHQYCRQIIDSANGKIPPTEVRPPGGSLKALRAAEKILRTGFSTKAEDDKGEGILKVICSLLTKNRMDSRKAGIEALCILTDLSKTHVSIAILVSRAVLLGDEGKEGAKIHQIILNLIQKRFMDDDQDDALVKQYTMEVDSDDEDFFPSDDEDDYSRPPQYNDAMSVLLNHALTALSNALHVLTTVNSFDDTSDASLTPFKTPESLIDCFLDDVKKLSEGVHMVFSLLHHIQRAPTKPHNASLASHTLCLLVKHSKRALQVAKSLGAIEYVQIAQDVGIASNIRLDEESRPLLMILAGGGKE